MKYSRAGLGTLVNAAVLYFASFFALTQPSTAQNFFIRQVLGPNPIIAGVPMSCGGAMSYVADIPDLGMAFPGALYFSPILFNMPPYMQWFGYAHECAHQFVGLDENAADCMAVQVGKQQGFMDQIGISQVCSFVYPSAGNWSHAPGPLRCQHMIACFLQVP